MSANQPQAELLYPLTLFRRNGGVPLPEFKVREGDQLPEPFRTLLVHDGDMTSRLEALYGGAIELEVLHREHQPDRYLREVVLHAGPKALPVEYGAIKINLDAFEGELRELIVEAHLPLGGLLNRFGIKYRSQPIAYIEFGADPVMREHFEMPEAERFYGRCNVLLGADNQELARIVELLRP